MPLSTSPVTSEVVTALGPVPTRVRGAVDPGGVAVLCVHAGLLTGRLWDAMVEHVGGGAAVIVPDLPLGAHRSAVPDRSLLTLPHLADALVEVLDAVGASRVVVVGNDTGGALSQVLAARHPARVAGLVLAGCEVLEHLPPPAIRPFVAAARWRWSMRLVVRLLAWPPVLADAGPLNVFSARGLGREHVAGLVAPALGDEEVLDDLRALFRSLRPETLLRASARLGRLESRAVVVWPRRDPFFTPRDGRRLAALLGTQVRWTERARTFVPWDRPDAVAAAVGDVLGRVAAGVRWK